MHDATRSQRKMWGRPAVRVPVADEERWCRALLWRHYGRRPGGARILASHAGSTQRAAENWLEARCAPTIKHLARIIASDAAVRAEVLKKLGELG